MAHQQQAAAKAKAQPKAAPIMITPYQHKWLISGDPSKNDNWLKELSCTEGYTVMDKMPAMPNMMEKIPKMENVMDKMPKMNLNPKRVCSRLLPGTAGAAESEKEAGCTTQ